MDFRRRDILAAAAILIMAQRSGRAEIIEGRAPWRRRAGNPPKPAITNRWIFFTPAEAETVEAIVDRIIPPDPETPGGKWAGCAVYIDNQLAGGTAVPRGFIRKARFRKARRSRARDHRLRLQTCTARASPISMITARANMMASPSRSLPMR
jgi:gluconate 2-dehydrogenase gamma chain